MSFLESLDRKLSEFGHGAINRTRAASETARVSSMISEEENKQYQLYYMLGEAFYNKYSAIAEGQMKNWCEEIKKSQALVGQYKEQLKYMSGITYCPNCNAEVAQGTVFCNNCGARVMAYQPQQQTPISGNTCPTCGVPVAPGQMFCTSCGGAISSQNAAPVPPQNMEPTPQEFVIPEPSDSFGAQPSNGFYSHPEVSFANDDQSVVGEAAVSQDAEPEQRVCPNCGKVLNEGQIFCTNCGTRL